MAIAFRAIAEDLTTASGVLVIDVPAGTANGDVMYMFVMSEQTISATPPTGWTALSGPTTIWAGTGTVAVYRRVASSEPSNYSVTCGGGGAQACGAIVSYSGVDNTTPEDVTIGANVPSSSSSSITAPSVTTATDSAKVLCFWGHRTAASITQPGGITFRDDGKASSTIYSAGDFDKASHGATGDQVATTGSTHATAGYQIAMRPAASQGIGARQVGIQPGRVSIISAGAQAIVSPSRGLTPRLACCG